MITGLPQGETGDWTKVMIELATAEREVERLNESTGSEDTPLLDFSAVLTSNMLGKARPWLALLAARGVFVQDC